MCHRVDCTTCKKPTWMGCGQHIEQALADVPEQDRCHCPSLFDKFKSFFGFGELPKTSN